MTQSGITSSSAPLSDGQVWHSQGSFLADTSRNPNADETRECGSVGGEWVSLQRRAEEGNKTKLGKRKECSRTAGDLLT